MASSASPIAPVQLVVIQGTTTEGRTFRPSDWAQRLASVVAQFGPDRRLRLNPFVSNSVIEGITCLVIDSRFAQQDPTMFDFLLEFAHSNRLVVRGCPNGETSGRPCVELEALAA